MGVTDEWGRRKTPFMPSRGTRAFDVSGGILRWLTRGTSCERPSVGGRMWSGREKAVGIRISAESLKKNTNTTEAKMRSLRCGRVPDTKPGGGSAEPSPPQGPVSLCLGQLEPISLLS